MTTIKAEVIADSINHFNKDTMARKVEPARLTTMRLTYPRFVHAEFMTHRVFSRNASSSRAIPVSRMIKEVMDNPAIPVHWGKNQKGMQALDECFAPINLNGEWLTNEQAWLNARDKAVCSAEAFEAAGYHKQIVNRLLEPFMHITVICTGTDYNNFFMQRDHPDAQPEIQRLAHVMKEAMRLSTPRDTSDTQAFSHLPFLTEEEVRTLDHPAKISVARCARTSYNNFDGSWPTIEKDLELYKKLTNAKPPHLSPFEHVCIPSSNFYYGNFRGWRSHRFNIYGGAYTSEVEASRGGTT